MDGRTITEGEIMNDQDARELIHSIIADKDKIMRGQLNVLWRHAQEHPTSVGRARAHKQFVSLTNYLNDLWEGWQAVSVALWPKEAVDRDAQQKDI
jgi:hypothetical protein